MTIWRSAPTGALAVLLAATSAVAGTDPLIGQFVGLARDRDLVGGAAIDREIDVVVAPHDPGGLRIDWTNVTLVDGRRDVPGVKRRSDQVLLAPASDRGFFLAGVGYDPFQDKREAEPMRGDALRWGVREGDALAVYSFVVLEDGRYELQAYERRATGDGLDLSFERVVDGSVVRRMAGHAVRAD